MTACWPGEPFPLGVHWDGHGCNVAVHAAHADGVELCLFHPDGSEERIELPERHGDVVHGYLPGIGPGQRYGLRAHGRFAPDEGRWVNPAKLLLDPYARAIEGGVLADPSLHPEDPNRPGFPDDRDSAPFMPRCIVVDPRHELPYDVRHDPAAPLRPAVPEADTVGYEVHVKGATMRHPGVPAALRGTYAGLAHPAFVEHLVALGVTTVELLPVQQSIDDPFLQERGLRNYWGYQTVGFFAPHNAYSASGQTGEQVREFRRMVVALHEAGLEVILDVVYNHTAEGNHLGPSLFLRGLDNEMYFLDPADRRRYLDFTGTGNSLNMGYPATLQLVMDSLRYWVTELHVDGFRFDLAATLAREPEPEVRLATFFAVVQQDPVLSRVKLVAEPWDIGHNGYQVGNFPPLWAEWNGRYRDTVRDFWRGQPVRSEFATRVAGSSDLYSDDGRRPFASVNFVTAHDGFTLADLVSYERKHNEANGDDNRDGTDDNRSSNHGVEGPTDDPQVLELRARQRRNLIATLLLSQGVPLLLGGDELGRTQLGNNNAYCQDNEISWFDWSTVDTEFLAFVRSLIALRRNHPVLRRRRFFTGLPADGGHLPDLCWYRPDGSTMTADDWARPGPTLAMFLNGEAITESGPQGQRIVDDSFYVCFNAAPEPVRFVVPPALGGPWSVVVDTARWAVPHDTPPVLPGDRVDVAGPGLVALRRPPLAS